MAKKIKKADDVAFKMLKTGSMKRAKGGKRVSAAARRRVIRVFWRRTATSVKSKDNPVKNTVSGKP